MSKRVRIGLREVRALTSGETIWDTAVAGFGARRQSGQAVAYILKYRILDGKRQRWYTIGKHGSPWTPDTARAEARRLLGEVAKGNDPAAAKQARRAAITVVELCDQYLQDARAGRVLKPSGVPKRASTLYIDAGRIERHIKPLLGTYAVAAVTRRDVERFLHEVAEGKTKARVKTKARGLARVKGGRTAANRSTGLLGAIFTYAVRYGMRADNPVHGLQRFADGKRDRRLTDEEYGLLGKAVARAAEEAIWPPSVAVVRFLAFTGWRKGEALGLRWSEVDLARRTATLSDTKTGRSVRSLSRRACGVLQDMALHPNGRGLVFPATRGEGPMTGFRKFWVRIAEYGTLPREVTPHVLRHSFASLAADLGYSEPTIAALVGHIGRSTTSRYVHSADAVLLAAADDVAERVSQLMTQDEIYLGAASEVKEPVARRKAQAQDVAA
jgi:integrase